MNIIRRLAILDLIALPFVLVAGWAGMISFFLNLVQARFATAGWSALLWMLGIVALTVLWHRWLSRDQLLREASAR